MNSTGAHWKNISFHKNFVGEIAIDAFFLGLTQTDKLRTYAN